MQYQYFINLDERGEFFADVRDSEENTILEIKGFGFFEDGWMRHSKDLAGLREYLQQCDQMTAADTLTAGNFSTY